MISDKLRKKKDESGLTIQQIADQCHIPASTVARILSGQTESPGFQTVYDIAHCLGCSLGDLEDRSGQDDQETTPEPEGLDPVLALYRKELRIKDRWIICLVCISCALVAVLIWILYDAMHGNIGAIRY